mmetsp:Transcript_69696/g.203982  ORF Transcript_69696/g.203982 Transcript_69696/m.203982 type:complete len:388 (+) Transcript_69696:105-1268(+)
MIARAEAPPPLVSSLGSVHEGPAVAWLALLGGMLWALGILGKRYGLEGVPCQQKVLWSAFTSLLFLLGTGVLPAVQLARSGGLAPSLGDPAWLQRLPWVVAAGVISGIGSLLAMYALARAGQHASSALVAVVQNGVYTAATPLLITAEIGEAANMRQWLGIAAVCMGVPLMDPGLMKMLRPMPSAKHCPSGEGEASEACYGAAPLHKMRAGVAAGGGSSVAVVAAAAAGVFWAVGSLGRRYGVRGSPHELQTAQAGITHLVINYCSCVAPAVCLACGDYMKVWNMLCDSNFRRRALVVAGTSVICGIGGFLITIGLAETGPNGGAAVSTIANGVYTVCGAAFIAAAYRERPAPAQWLGVALVVAGVSVVGLAAGGSGLGRGPAILHK